MTLSLSELETLWGQAGGDAEMAETMAAIAMAESSGNPNALGPVGEVGLWQINPRVWGSLATFDPLGNARAAVHIAQVQGLGAWTTYTTGAYRKYLVPKGASVTISGPDLSNFQAGLKIQPGTQFVIAKATEGTYYKDASYADFMQQAAAVGAVRSAYHFLKQEGSAAAQARFAFGVVGTMSQMLDVETEGSSKPGMLEIMSYINTTKALGGWVWGVYLPHWYWQEIGSPDLAPITAAGAFLVSSAYDYVGADNGPGWAAYGGVTPAVWQFTDKLPYGGQHVDFNAFKGTQDQFRTIVTGAAPGVPAPSGGPVAAAPTSLQLEVWGFHGDNADGLAGDQPDTHQTLLTTRDNTAELVAAVKALAAEVAAIKAKLGA